MFVSGLYMLLYQRAAQLELCLGRAVF